MSETGVSKVPAKGNGVEWRVASDGGILRLPKLHHTADTFALASLLLLLHLRCAWSMVFNRKLAPLAV